MSCLDDVHPNAPRRVLADGSVDVFAPGTLMHFDVHNRHRYTGGANGAVRRPTSP